MYLWLDYKTLNFTFLQNHFFNMARIRQSNAAGHKILHAISNGKLVFADFPKHAKDRTKIGQNH